MRHLFITLAVLATHFSFANTNEKPIDSKIKEVTVFLRGAQIKRTSSTQLSAGTTLIKLENLSGSIDPNSIEVNGKGNFTILSVTHGTNYLKNTTKPKNIVQLEDSLIELNYEFELKNKLNAVLESEWQLINSNKEVNNNAGFDIEDLDDLATYYRERLAEIVKGQIALKRDQATIQQNISRIQKQLNELNNKRNVYAGEIIVEVQAEASTKANLNVSYYVQNAGWTPSYDIRVKDSNSPIALNYRAQVYQYSGEDWEDVKMTLSTGNPSRGATKPTFYPWRLNVIQPYQPVYNYNYKAGAARPAAKAMDASAIEEIAIAEDETLREAYTSANYTTSTETAVNSVFEINIPKTVLSDGKPHNVEVQKYELKAQYKYFAAPKLDKDVFLVGKISGWEDYNLLSGEANIYYDGTYTGKSHIDAGRSNDTLELSLGRDNGIIVNRTKIKEFTQNQIIGPNKKETVGYSVSIRNTKNLPVNINLMDQLPVSSDASIEVEVLDISGAKQDKENGYLNWDVKLEPAETINYVIKYSVKYPKDKKINL